MVTPKSTRNAILLLVVLVVAMKGIEMFVVSLMKEEVMGIYRVWKRDCGLKK